MKLDLYLLKAINIKKISEDLKFHIVNIIYGITLSLRFYNGDLKKNIIDAIHFTLDIS